MASFDGDILGSSSQRTNKTEHGESDVVVLLVPFDLSRREEGDGQIGSESDGAGERALGRKMETEEEASEIRGLSPPCGRTRGGRTEGSKGGRASRRALHTFFPLSSLSVRGA